MHGWVPVAGAAEILAAVASSRRGSMTRTARSFVTVERMLSGGRQREAPEPTPDVAVLPAAQEAMKAAA